MSPIYHQQPVVVWPDRLSIYSGDAAVIRYAIKPENTRNALASSGFHVKITKKRRLGKKKNPARPGQ